MSTTESTSRTGPLESTKITDANCAKLAVVYVRQSTQQQVVENRLSLARQYALADHARALGWPPDRVLVIDEDLGLSGRSADARLGFQRLVEDCPLEQEYRSEGAAEPCRGLPVERAPRLRGFETGATGRLVRYSGTECSSRLFLRLSNPTCNHVTIRSGSDLRRMHSPGDAPSVPQSGVCTLCERRI